MKKIRVLTCLSLALFICLVAPLKIYAADLEVKVYSPNTGAVVVGAMAMGPDGNMWFTKPLEHQVGKITPSGVATEYNAPSGVSPTFIAAGPDGNMWATTDTVSKRVLQMATNGSILGDYNFSPKLANDSNANSLTLSGIAAGPDGNMWINISRGNNGAGGYIGKVTPSGDISLFPVENGGFGIAAGPDGNMWFAMNSAANSTNKIGKITTSGAVTEYTLPGTGDGVWAVAAGPDGNMWYLRSPMSNSVIGKISMYGEAEEFTLPTNSGAAYGLISGPDGRMWYGEFNLKKIGAITTQGSIEEYDISAGTPISMALGSDKNIWFALMVNDGSATEGRIGQMIIPVTDIPESIASVTPMAPKTGAILNAIILSAAAISLVFPIAYEYHRNSRRNHRSSR